MFYNRGATGGAPRRRSRPAGGLRMCGRFTLTAEVGVVARRFGAPPAQGGGTAPRYNVAPTQTVVTVTATGERRLERMRWGLVPSWAKNPKIGSRLINARAETLTE